MFCGHYVPAWLSCWRWEVIILPQPEVFGHDARTDVHFRPAQGPARFAIHSRHRDIPCWLLRRGSRRPSLPPCYAGSSGPRGALSCPLRLEELVERAWRGALVSGQGHYITSRPRGQSAKRRTKRPLGEESCVVLSVGAAGTDFQEMHLMLSLQEPAEPQLPILTRTDSRYIIWMSLDLRRKPDCSIPVFYPRFSTSRALGIQVDRPKSSGLLSGKVSTCASNTSPFGPPISNGASSSMSITSALPRARDT